MREIRERYESLHRPLNRDALSVLNELAREDVPWLVARLASVQNEADGQRMRADGWRRQSDFNSARCAELADRLASAGTERASATPPKETSAVADPEALRGALDRMLRAYTGQHTNGREDAIEKREAVAQARAALSGASSRPPQGSLGAPEAGDSSGQTGEVK